MDFRSLNYSGPDIFNYKYRLEPYDDNWVYVNSDQGFANYSKLKPGGRLIGHALNGANPITGSESLAQNFDHYNTFTEYTMHQVMEFSGFKDIKVIPLHLYVFWANPVNYALIAMSAMYTLFFRVSFMMYGKTNKIFTKKIGAVAFKPS